MEQTKELILEIMRQWMEFDHDYSWKGYSELFREMEETGCSELITLTGIKSAMKELKAEGKVIYSTCVNYDGGVQGSGYFLQDY